MYAFPEMGPIREHPDASSLDSVRLVKRVRDQICTDAAGTDTASSSTDARLDANSSSMSTLPDPVLRNANSRKIAIHAAASPGRAPARTSSRNRPERAGLIMKDAHAVPASGALVRMPSGSRPMSRPTLATRASIRPVQTLPPADTLHPLASSLV
jgi:hypothetical protein